MVKTNITEIEAKTKITEEYLNRRPLLKYEYKRLVAVCNDPQEMTCNDLKRLAEKSKVPEAVKPVVREKMDLQQTLIRQAFIRRNISNR